MRSKWTHRRLVRRRAKKIRSIRENKLINELFTNLKRNFNPYLLEKNNFGDTYHYDGKLHSTLYINGEECERILKINEIDIPGDYDIKDKIHDWLAHKYKTESVPLRIRDAVDSLK